MKRRVQRQPAVAVMVAAAAVIALAGCTASTTAETAGDASVAPPTTVSHVHGVDVDDARDMVTVATHYGLISIDISSDADPNAPASVLGDYRGDVMAFVRSDDRLLLSGHPPLGSSDPANVGVIDSDLEASTWAPLALSGEVDFHAMSRAPVGSPTLIAGLDSASGAVWTSADDGVTWQQGSTISARDIAVGVDGESLIATTESGPQRSKDLGMTWSPITGAPLLVLIQSGFTTSGEPVLLGVDADGVLHVSSDESEWLSQGVLPFVPEAFGVGERGTIVIVSTQRAMRSSDAGATWAQIADMTLELVPPQ